MAANTGPALPDMTVLPLLSDGSGGRDRGWARSQGRARMLRGGQAVSPERISRLACSSWCSSLPLLAAKAVVSWPNRTEEAIS